jgi:hypothetical protein
MALKNILRKHTGPRGPQGQWTLQERARMEWETSRERFVEVDLTQGYQQICKDHTQYWEKLFKDVPYFSLLGTCMRLLAKSWVQARPWLKRVVLWVTGRTSGYRTRKKKFDDMYNQNALGDSCDEYI